MERQRFSLIAIAGLPGRVASAVKKRFDSSGNLPACEVIVQPSPVTANLAEDGLYPTRVRQGLLRAVAQKTVKSRVAYEPDFAPDRLFLIYLPSSDERLLMDMFGTCCFVKSVGRPDRGWSFSEDEAFRVLHPIVHSLAKRNDASLLAMEKRLRNLKKTILGLPPANFAVDARMLNEVLINCLLSGTWDEAERLKPTKFTKESKLPMRGGRAWYFKDSRDLVFPPDDTQHGIPRDTISDPEQAILTLRQLYRFGVALPFGFHHDVQRAGRKLSGQEFQCCQKGPTVVSGSHANVYPNDFVRVPG